MSKERQSLLDDLNKSMSSMKHTIQDINFHPTAHSAAVYHKLRIENLEHSVRLMGRLMGMEEEPVPTKQSTISYTVGKELEAAISRHVESLVYKTQTSTSRRKIEKLVEEHTQRIVEWITEAMSLPKQTVTSDKTTLKQFVKGAMKLTPLVTSQDVPHAAFCNFTGVEAEFCNCGLADIRAGLLLYEKEHFHEE
jgi:hypothetical protein